MNILGSVSKVVVLEVRNFNLNQCTESNSPDFGGVLLPENGYAEPTDTAHAIEGLYGLYALGDENYSAAFSEQKLLLFLNHLLSSQHKDGTLDLMNTNFHCTATFAFTVQYLYYAFLLARSKSDAVSKMVVEKLIPYFSKGINALAFGGFHTPNHRWVIASAIMQLLHLIEKKLIPAADTQTDALEKTLNEYLGEGIDMDAFGEYTEKSVGIYNIHCNNSLLIMEECNAKLKTSYFETGSLLAKVKQNLDLMPAYIEPDGTLFSAKSTRQDSGYKLYPDPYFINYLFYGHLSRDAHYLETAWQLLSLNSNRSRRSMESFCRLLSTPGAADQPFTEKQHNPEQSILQLRKKEYFNQPFGLFRKNEEKTSVTLAAGSTFFLKVQKENNSVTFRLSASWYGTKGQFTAAQIIRESETQFVLPWESTWGYIRPFSCPPETSVWEQQDHDAREKFHMHTLKGTITVRIHKTGCDFDIHMEGDSRVPYKLEAVFSPGGHLSVSDPSESAYAEGTAGREIILGSGFTYRLESTPVTVTGGFAEHSRGAGMRGSEPLVPGTFTVTSTGFSPDRRTISIT